jgi:hypothetical protein
VTRLKFDLKATAPKMFFEPARWLNDEEYAVCQEKGASEAAKQAVTMSFAKQEPTVAAPAPIALPGKPPKTARALPAPAAEEETADAPEEPTKRKEAAPATAPKRAASIASVIDNWDADDE